MIEAFWIPLLPPYLIGLVLSFLVEAMLTPRPVAPWRRPLAAVGVHVGVWTLAFALELMLFRRPYFAVANVLAIELLIVLVSNAKYQALREPFVYPDFEYFTDAIRHPRLYLPFFGVGRAVISGGGYGLALWAGLSLEDSVTAGAGVWLVSFADLPQEHMFDPTAPTVPFYLHSTGLAVAGFLATKLSLCKCKASFVADSDLVELGLIASLCAYARQERMPLPGLELPRPFNMPGSAAHAPSPLPDLVVVQSESFFDARRFYPHIKSDVLASFDRLQSEANHSGILHVAARGANTVRTEFAFLSGVGAAELGVHRYNPYRRLAIQGFPTIASYLRSQGYRTICVHPYHATFYQRNNIYPLLGFDEFVDIAAFKDAERAGPYVGDRAVAEKVIAMLRSTARGPLYVHVITMENHGPLHWEKVSAQDGAQVLGQGMPDGCEDLVAYARHLRNADAMFGALREALIAGPRPAALCVFGDHVPIMPAVYQKLGEPDGATNYLVWRSEAAVLGPPQALAVEHLSALFLRSAGFHLPTPQGRGDKREHYCAID